jgi:hypothetical protein
MHPSEDRSVAGIVVVAIVRLLRKVVLQEVGGLRCASWQGKRPGYGSWGILDSLGVLVASLLGNVSGGSGWGTAVMVTGSLSIILIDRQYAHKPPYDHGRGSEPDETGTSRRSESYGNKGRKKIREG